MGAPPRGQLPRGGARGRPRSPERGVEVRRRCFAPCVYPRVLAVLLLLGLLGFSPRTCIPALAFGPL
eukprot:8520128-Pyramimonas_sp.AAC.1